VHQAIRQGSVKAMRVDGDTGRIGLNACMVGLNANAAPFIRCIVTTGATSVSS
jgi:hypothetical protein